MLLLNMRTKIRNQSLKSLYMLCFLADMLIITYTVKMSIYNKSTSQTLNQPITNSYHVVDQEASGASTSLRGQPDVGTSYIPLVGPLPYIQYPHQQGALYARYANAVRHILSYVIKSTI